MDATFHAGNRRRLYDSLPEGSVLILFAGQELRRSSDACYPFYCSRNFLYLTGIRQKQSVLLARKEAGGTLRETLYLLPKDAMAERWTGRRLSEQEARDLSGLRDIRPLAEFPQAVHAALQGCGVLYLDLYRCEAQDPDTQAHAFAREARQRYPWLTLADAAPLVGRLRLIKQPCEIEALRRAEEMTRRGILAMMAASRPGMYEYQYKAEFDRALGQFGPEEAGFQSIISAGANNFCIHYDAYTGRAEDGDMILNDVGAQYDGMIVDVSRGWPCNGKFTSRQRLLYECALATSDYLFSIIRPGMRMEEVDATIRRYNAGQLVRAGVMASAAEVGTYMWHGGAHHIGYDVHDAVPRPEVLAPGMVFCVDVGIYHEAWGIGFRLEDNCLVTQDGCENLSAAIPRTVWEIEEAMKK